MDKNDIITLIGELEDGILYVCEGWAEATGLDHLIKSRYHGHTYYYTFPDEDDICFCEECEQAWLKGEGSRCICGDK